MKYDEYDLEFDRETMEDVLPGEFLFTRREMERARRRRFLCEY